MSETAPTVADMLPAAFPRGWVSIPRPNGSLLGSAWFNWRDLTVCVSVDVCEPGGVWLHTSVSTRGGRKLPSWEALVAVKEAVHGDRLVVQILPPRASYVNVAEVLHLWERLDAPTLPDDVRRRS